MNEDYNSVEFWIEDFPLFVWFAAKKAGLFKRELRVFVATLTTWYYQSSDVNRPTKLGEIVLSRYSERQEPMEPYSWLKMSATDRFYPSLHL